MRKKNLSVRRKIFKVWKREKKCKCRIPGVRKKNEIERKVPGKKMVKFLLSLCSLVGRHVVNEPKVGCHVVNELEIS